MFADIEDRQYLSVVRDKRLSNKITRHNQMLQDFQSGADDFLVASVKST